jgi:N-acetylglucosamine-6-phosphate deacetylase
MAAASLGPGRHRLGRWTVEVGEDLAAWAPDRSHLVGSAMTMPQAEANLRTKLMLREAEIESLLVTNPRRALAGR